MLSPFLVHRGHRPQLQLVDVADRRVLWVNRSLLFPRFAGRFTIRWESLMKHSQETKTLQCGIFPQLVNCGEILHQPYHELVMHIAQYTFKRVSCQEVYQTQQA